MRVRTSCVLVAFFLLSLIGCEKKAQPVEKTIAPSATTVSLPSTTELPAAKLPPPTAASVRAALQRVFGEAVRLDENAPTAFVVGDFNSDDSQDLMAIVRPEPMHLADLNGELANWTITEPRHAWLPPAGKKVVKLPPVSEMREQVAQGEVLIAVIHGFGAEGWRNKDARQAYLLRDVSGKFEGTSHMEHLPRQVLGGDVVRERVGNESGFLYWFSGKYVWQAGSPQQVAQQKPDHRG